MILHKSKKRIGAAVLTAAAAEAAAVWSVYSDGLCLPAFLIQTILAAGAGLLICLDLRPGRKVQGFFLFAAAAAAFYGLESFTHNPLLMAPLPQLMNLLIFWGFFALLFFLLGTVKRAVITGSILTAMIGIANHYTLEFRDNPILPWDLKSFSTALSVTDNYEYAVPAAMVFSILLFLYLCVLAEKTSMKAPAPKKRICAALLSVCLLFAMKTAMCTTAVTDRVLTFSNLFTQWATYRDNGFAVSFLQNTKYLDISEPDGYSPELVADEARRQKELGISSGTDTASSGQTAPGIQTEAEDDRPNIIVIMNEAFSDLSVLHDFETSEDYMPFIHSLMDGGENTVSGQVYVSVVGGNTANTEFEFLTGDSLAFLPSGSVAYQQYISEELPSLASSMSALDYRTIAIHPYLAGGWNRDEVYPLLGFQETYFRDSFTSPQIIRKYISDRSSYQKIEELYEQKEEGEKLFVFNVTMQNHSGYTEIFDNFPIRVRLTELKGHEGTENYLSLIRESDQAFRELTEYFSQEDEKTIILMFGDHQPNDYVAECIASLTGTAREERDLEESQNRFIVPFVIWANYDIEEQSSLRLSANYLGALLTETAGLPMTQYQQYLSRLRETLPVITANVCIDSSGRYYSIAASDEENPHTGLLDQYWRFQYNHMFDQEHYPEDFYTLSVSSDTGGSHPLSAREER